MKKSQRVILDTNVFVAAQFNHSSASHALIAHVEHNDLIIPWHELTQIEIEYQLKKIPPLSYTKVAALFMPEFEYPEELDISGYRFVPDKDDRPFAALAEATDSMLATNDDHLLSVAPKLAVFVGSPRMILQKVKNLID